MPFAPRSLALSLAVLAILGTAVGAHAESSLVSSASDSLSTSITQSSKSLSHSSDSSSKHQDMAQGEYRIVDVAAVDGQPGQVVVTLQPLAAGAPEGTFRLVMPARTADAQALAAGGTLAVTTRPYGLQFAKAGAAEPFLLVMDDDWHRELKSNQVS